MLLLAARLGLRALDIANITFNNINWECNKITLVQSKTGKEIELPLLANIGEAIIDCLKYGRKNSTLPQIFLYTRAPYAALSGSAVSACITHLIEVYGVNTEERKHGLHSMRHSLASRFLENREPLPVISEALGHQKTSSTMFYLRIDYVLAWGLSNTHDSGFFQELLEQALQKHGHPKIFNTYQGSEFTANTFTKMLNDRDIKISMDGKGRALDTIFVERLWRRVKYEYLYLSRPETGIALYEGLSEYFDHCNSTRMHQSLSYKTLEEVYKAA